jgi:hypothetical protein
MVFSKQILQHNPFRCETFPSDVPTPIFSAMLATRGGLVAKPNYQFEKRQRDLAKKSKQEEKRRQKQAVKPSDSLVEDEKASPSLAPSPEPT